MADQYAPTPEFVKEWNRIRRKVDTLAFRGLQGQNSRDSIVVGPASSAGDKTQSPVIAQLFVVNLTQTGGSTGTTSTTASWTYTAKTLDNNTTLGTSLAPQRPRPNGTATAATLGSAYYDTTGTLVLFEALEKYGTGHC